MSAAGTVVVDREGSLYVRDIVQYVGCIRKKFLRREVGKWFPEADYIPDGYAFHVVYEKAGSFEMYYDTFTQARKIWESLTGERYVGGEV